MTVDYTLSSLPFSPLFSHLPVLCLVAQSCRTVCDPMAYSPPSSSVHGDSTGKNTGADCHALLQEIFPTPGWNPGLPYCRWILYPLSYQGSPLHLPTQTQTISGKDLIGGHIYISKHQSTCLSPEAKR